MTIENITAALTALNAIYDGEFFDAAEEVCSDLEAQAWRMGYELDVDAHGTYIAYER